MAHPNVAIPEVLQSIRRAGDDLTGEYIAHDMGTGVYVALKLARKLATSTRKTLIPLLRVSLETNGWRVSKQRVHPSFIELFIVDSSTSPSGSGTRQ